MIDINFFKRQDPEHIRKKKTQVERIDEEMSEVLYNRIKINEDPEVL